MPLYCSHCDEVYWYQDFRGKRKICPSCGNKLLYYKTIEETPVRRCCYRCAFFMTMACGVATFTPKAPYYPNHECARFKLKCGVQK